MVTHLTLGKITGFCLVIKNILGKVQIILGKWLRNRLGIGLKGLKVLSLFDGISCGQVALERAGFKVDTYYASEIEESAIKITQKNYPDTIQLGDITKLTNDQLDRIMPIDIVIGGSPCQDLSNYKYDRGEVTGLNGEKSGLFYEYIRILKYVNPKYFLLENVASMEDKWRDLISEVLGVKPIMINSALVSAQERKRYYWTNIEGITLPEDKGLVIRDIIQDDKDIDKKYWYDREFTYNGDDNKVQCTLIGSGLMRNMREVYNQNSKCNTLLCDGDGGNRQKKVFQNGKCRKFTPLEYERMQTLSDNYTDCVCDSKRYTGVGNGWTVDIVAHIFKYIK